jgi:ParB family transcriptional regulator, chromosome partitioning protein
MTKKRGLGRGLDALLGDALARAGEAEAAGSVSEIAIELIAPGKAQPRMHFDKDKLAELAASIKAQGLVQPVVVRAIDAQRYELIAGERRWRAAQLAGLRQIPAIVRNVPDQAAVAIALIENIQREDLSPIEEAQALKRLIDEYDLTHQSAADAVGRSRVAVSNLLRLLELAPGVRTMLQQGEIEMGHARALLSLDAGKQLKLAMEARSKQWTVREIEAAVRLALKAPAPARAASAPQSDANIAALARSLSEKLGTSVAIEHARGRGKLIVRYGSLDELDGILARIR